MKNKCIFLIFVLFILTLVLKNFNATQTPISSSQVVPYQSNIPSQWILPDKSTATTVDLNKNAFSKTNATFNAYHFPSGSSTYDLDLQGSKLNYFFTFDSKTSLMPQIIFDSKIPSETRLLNTHAHFNLPLLKYDKDSKKVELYQNGKKMIYSPIRAYDEGIITINEQEQFNRYRRYITNEFPSSNFTLVSNENCNLDDETNFSSCTFKGLIGDPMRPSSVLELVTLDTGKISTSCNINIKKKTQNFEMVLKAFGFWGTYFRQKDGEQVFAPTITESLSNACDYNMNSFEEFDILKKTQTTDQYLHYILFWSYFSEYVNSESVEEKSEFISKFTDTQISKIQIKARFSCSATVTLRGYRQKTFATKKANWRVDDQTGPIDTIKEDTLGNDYMEFNVDDNHKYNSIAIKFNTDDCIGKYLQAKIYDVAVFNRSSDTNIPDIKVLKTSTDRFNNQIAYDWEANNNSIQLKQIESKFNKEKIQFRDNNEIAANFYRNGRRIESYVTSLSNNRILQFTKRFNNGEQLLTEKWKLTNSQVTSFQTQNRPKINFSRSHSLRNRAFIETVSTTNLSQEYIFNPNHIKIVDTISGNSTSSEYFYDSKFRTTEELHCAEQHCTINRFSKRIRYDYTGSGYEWTQRTIQSKFEGKTDIGKQVEKNTFNSKFPHRIISSSIGNQTNFYKNPLGSNYNLTTCYYYSHEANSNQYTIATKQQQNSTCQSTYSLKQLVSLANIGESYEITDYTPNKIYVSSRSFGNALQDMVHTLDSNGKVIETKNYTYQNNKQVPLSTVSFEYDENFGWVTSKTETDALNNISQTIKYAFSDDGRDSLVQYPDGTISGDFTNIPGTLSVSMITANNYKNGGSHPLISNSNFPGIGFSNDRNWNQNILDNSTSFIVTSVRGTAYKSDASNVYSWVFFRPSDESNITTFNNWPVSFRNSYTNSEGSFVVSTEMPENGFGAPQTNLTKISTDNNGSNTIASYKGSTIQDTLLSEISFDKHGNNFSTKTINPDGTFPQNPVTVIKTIEGDKFKTKVINAPGMESLSLESGINSSSITYQSKKAQKAVTNSWQTSASGNSITNETTTRKDGEDAQTHTQTTSFDSNVIRNSTSLGSVTYDSITQNIVSNTQNDGATQSHTFNLLEGNKSENWETSEGLSRNSTLKLNNDGKLSEYVIRDDKQQVLFGVMLLYDLNHIPHSLSLVQYDQNNQKVFSTDISSYVIGDTIYLKDSLQQMIIKNNEFSLFNGINDSETIKFSIFPNLNENGSGTIEHILTFQGHERARVISTLNSQGNITNMEIKRLGNTQKSIDFKYDASGSIKSIADKNNPNQSITFVPSHSSTIRKYGTSTDYTRIDKFDEMGRLSGWEYTARDILAQEAMITRDPVNGRIQSIVSYQQEIYFEYTDEGRVKQKIVNNLAEGIYRLYAYRVNSIGITDQIGIYETTNPYPNPYDSSNSSNSVALPANLLMTVTCEDWNFISYCEEKDKNNNIILQFWKNYVTGESYSKKGDDELYYHRNVVIGDITGIIRVPLASLAPVHKKSNSQVSLLVRINTPFGQRKLIENNQDIFEMEIPLELKDAPGLNAEKCLTSPFKIDDGVQKAMGYCIQNTAQGALRANTNSQQQSPFSTFKLKGVNGTYLGLGTSQGQGLPPIVANKREKTAGFFTARSLQNTCIKHNTTFVIEQYREGNSSFYIVIRDEMYATQSQSSNLEQHTLTLINHTNTSECMKHNDTVSLWSGSFNGYLVLDNQNGISIDASRQPSSNARFTIDMP